MHLQERLHLLKMLLKLWLFCQVRVVSAAGEMQGGSRIVDLHNGLYEVFYTAPGMGAFLVHVQYADAGVNPVPVDIRGSPFAVECTDPWVKYRVLGALPARRQVSPDPSHAYQLTQTAEAVVWGCMCIVCCLV